MQLSLHYSPCPNDTFIFHALAHGLVRAPGVDFAVSLADVERLNEAAASGVPDVCKVSVAAAAELLGQYRILRAGGALGRGVGPVLVSRPGARLEDLDGRPVAIPGRRTTAALIFGLLCRERGIRPHITELVYDQVMPAVAAGECAAGVVIHEGRFTYAAQGLDRLLDLGAWWEEERGLPIPLGCIVMRRSLGVEAARGMDAAIRESLLYARANPEASREYIRQHAQEMAPEVIARHIETFVTEASLDLGEEGVRAGQALMAEALRQAGRPACIPDEAYLPPL